MLSIPIKSYNMINGTSSLISDQGLGSLTYPALSKHNIIKLKKFNIDIISLMKPQRQQIFVAGTDSSVEGRTWSPC